MKTIEKERQGKINLSYCSIEGTRDVISNNSSFNSTFVRSTIGKKIGKNNVIKLVTELNSVNCVFFCCVNNNF